MAVHRSIIIALAGICIAFFGLTGCSLFGPDYMYSCNTLNCDERN